MIQSLPYVLEHLYGNPGTHLVSKQLMMVFTIVCLCFVNRVQSIEVDDMSGGSNIFVSHILSGRDMLNQQPSKKRCKDISYDATDNGNWKDGNPGG